MYGSSKGRERKKAVKVKEGGLDGGEGGKLHKKCRNCLVFQGTEDKWGGKIICTRRSLHIGTMVPEKEKNKVY